MKDVLENKQLMSQIKQTKPLIHCNIYEDNESCIAMAKNMKFNPWMEILAMKYHHLYLFN